jgi:hypothetical protein
MPPLPALSCRCKGVMTLQRSFRFPAVRSSRSIWTDSWAKSCLHSYKAADETADGQSKCFDLNRGLRNGLRFEEISHDLCKIAKALDTVFMRCPRLKASATVFRGIDERRYFPIQEVDTRFRSFQYWSTTVEEEKTESFMKPSEKLNYGAVFELKLPKGFPAYNMETLHGLRHFLKKNPALIRSKQTVSTTFYFADLAIQV